MTIHIDLNTCIQCGRCAKVCPSEILRQEAVGKPIEIHRPEHCIGCGHCVDVCPTSSLLHSEFPAEKVHVINYNLMPKPEQMMALIKARRSNRSLTSKPIPTHVLDQIVEAAACAPTATNAQSLSFTVITDPKKLLQVSEFTIGVFDGLAKVLLNPIVKTILQPFMKDVYKYVPVFKRLKENQEAGKDPVLRKATALLIIHTPKGNRFGSEDANLAYQNASLMAQTLGVSQIYMGFVLSAIKQNGKNALEKQLGINGQIKAIMALGYPEFTYTKYTDRKEINKHFME